MLITFETDKASDWGPRTDSIQIYVKGQETRMKNNRITLLADIWEDFSKLTREQRQNAPEIEVSNTIIDFERGSNTRTRELTVRNTGKETLQIRKVVNDDNEAFQTSLDKTSLKPGEAARLRITFTPSKTKKRSINQHLTIISNDPSNSRVIVNVQAAK